ncbi:MAG: hypothetical protein P4L74_06435 [Candidatus Doudnabacteria bacterium]|nr:hypothetical protein [Candidatus Doudnabacteria bacterium]
MLQAERSKNNPLLLPDPNHPWEAEAAFNGCPVKDGGNYHMVYRALSGPHNIGGVNLKLSTVGCADSPDGESFHSRRQLIVPEQSWEKFGCEDPRVTKIGNEYYIFYTALGEYPFRASGIKVALAKSKDLKNISDKYLITPFNAKAMSLFPEKINDKFMAVFTAHTDSPPARLCLATFENEQDMWSPAFWEKWQENLEDHSLFIKRRMHDHAEIGAPPIKTKDGWLLVFSYIQNYLTPPATFGIEAVLLDLENPYKIIGRTLEPFLVPRENYELHGQVPNIVFPSGALLEGNELKIYYGGADTNCCAASLDASALLKLMKQNGAPIAKLRRYGNNPILAPNTKHAWEDRAVFNPAALYDDGKVHLLYRAMGLDNTSVFGYAKSYDGFKFDDRFPEPAYVPRAKFEQKLNVGGNSGCEDPRLTKISETIYVCYTAYDGKNPPRVALSSISVKDFLVGVWRWSEPVLISPPGVDDKDAALFPEKINGKFGVLHRIGECIFLDFVPDFNFGGEKWLQGNILMRPRPGMWDSIKIGTAAPPLKTPRGWLLLYHGVSEHHKYRVGAALLDLNNPMKVLARTDEPIFEPEMPYEKNGQIPMVVFPCGAVIIDDKLFVYYGGADTVIGVATAKLGEII